MTPLITISSAVQQIRPRDKNERMEGVAFSSCGRLLAIATSDANNILLFRRETADALFETTPYAVIGADHAPMSYPHDVAFSPDAGSRFLAVAQRGSSVIIFERVAGSDRYGPQPVKVISGPDSGLEYSDGVAFLPPDGEYVAACNLVANTVAFYRNRSGTGAARFDHRPCAVFTSPAIEEPDGMAFSTCGNYLALANHGGHTVPIFSRATVGNGSTSPEFGPWPVVVIRDATFRFPHSVAFSRSGNHLLVTNAGGNYFNTYCCNQYDDGDQPGTTWSREPTARSTLIADDEFREVNCMNDMEGGPKGIATYDGQVAVCSPEAGVKLFRLHDGGPLRTREPAFVLPDDATPRKTAGWFIDEIDGEHRLRNRKTPCTFRFNDSATAIWELCDGERSVRQIAELLQPLAGESGAIAAEVKHMIERLDACGLVNCGSG